MVKLKLKEDYANQFLTTDVGVNFFKDWKEQKQPEWVEVDDDIYKKTTELKEYVRMGMLIKQDEDNNKKIASEEKKRHMQVKPSDVEKMEQDILKIQLNNKKKEEEKEDLEKIKNKIEKENSISEMDSNEDSESIEEVTENESAEINNN